jgi:HTH-type transcriptional regulator, competence development regulator
MTPFGKFVRRERKDRRMMLGELADKLGVSAPYLSQMETGAKPIREGLAEKLIRVLELSAAEGNELIRAAAKSTTEFSIKVRSNASSDERFLASRLATSFARLSPEAKRRIREIVEDPSNG